MDLRTLGQSELRVSPVALGCWPIAGITSIDVTRDASLATLRAAFEAGINFFDTAYSYGYSGESERYIAETLGSQRDDIVIATKAGLHWNAQQEKLRDARPETILRHCDESLQRLKTDRIDLYYLHAPDLEVPVAETAGAFRKLLDQGKIRAVGASNCTVRQYAEFHEVCPLTAAQPHYNMLQREIEEDIIPWCRANQVAVVNYWPLMKGFLAGKLPRNMRWDPRDSRQHYPIFQGEHWERTHDFLDALRGIAQDAELTVAQLVIAWTIRQPGITSALCGAKRPDQIEETARAMDVELTTEQCDAIDAAITARGDVPGGAAV